eukprot:m.198032 g.198032  ORF g.198032 m.198032 type:complete len:657 (-) comp16830_c0_seq2:724-2694(-)
MERGAEGGSVFASYLNDLTAHLQKYGRSDHYGSRQEGQHDGDQYGRGGCGDEYSTRGDDRHGKERRSDSTRYGKGGEHKRNDDDGHLTVAYGKRGSHDAEEQEKDRRVHFAELHPAHLGLDLDLDGREKDEPADHLLYYANGYQEDKEQKEARAHDHQAVSSEQLHRRFLSSSTKNAQYADGQSRHRAQQDLLFDPRKSTPKSSVPDGRLADEEENHHSGNRQQYELNISHISLNDDVPPLSNVQHSARKPGHGYAAHTGEFDSGLEDQLGVYRQRDAIYQEELAALQKETYSLQQQLNNAHTKLQSLTLEVREGEVAREKARRLERYLKTVPTSEEYENKCNEVARLQHVEEQLQTQLREEKTQGHVLRQQINSQEATIHDLKREITVLREQVLETGEIKNTAIEEMRTVLRQVTQERNEARQLYERVSNELSSRIAESKSLQQKLDLEDRVLEEQRHQTSLRDAHIQELQAKEAEFVRAERHLRASLTDAEDIRESLLRKLSAQASTIRDLRESIAALTDQNQMLVSQNQMLRSGRDLPLLDIPKYAGSEAQVKASGTLTASEADALQDELGKTLQQFARVFDLALARLNNSDDDIRRLLGFSAQREIPLFVRTTDVSSRLECISEMQRFVERLESGISDAYARDVGHEACGIQ